MNWEKLLPILGIFFGWVLSELSKRFRDQNEDKKLINQIITQLLIFRYQLKQYNAFVKGVVEVYGSSPEAEKERQRIMEKHYITGDDIGKSFSDIFDKVSAFDPILAVSIGHKVTRMKKIKDEKLNSVSHLPPIYETLLNVTTDVHDSIIIELEKLILQLSFRSSIILWIRMKKEITSKSNLENWGKTMKLFNDLVEKEYSESKQEKTE